jgi:hypothetical protein
MLDPTLREGPRWNSLRHTPWREGNADLRRSSLREREGEGSSCRLGGDHTCCGGLPSGYRALVLSGQRRSGWWGAPRGGGEVGDGEPLRAAVESLQGSGHGLGKGPPGGSTEIGWGGPHAGGRIRFHCFMSWCGTHCGWDDDGTFINFFHGIRTNRNT